MQVENVGVTKYETNFVKTMVMLGSTCHDNDLCCSYKSLCTCMVNSLSQLALVNKSLECMYVI